MSDGMNKVFLLGNLGADPELRYTANGTAVLNLRLATNETWLDKEGKKQERVEWHSIVIWGNRAEALSKILAKGACIVVEGGLRTSSYEGKDGVKRYKTEVYARDVALTPRRTPATLPGEEDLLARSAGFKNGKNGALPLEPEATDEIPF
jgi:single-strand DNA-binding protein